MSLSLDLTTAKAKVTRAYEHLEAIRTEIPVILLERNPYAVTVNKIGGDPSFLSVRLKPGTLSEPHLSAVFGDLIHNLRGALDYIVTSLADASGAKLTTRHQFPISIDPNAYRATAGTLTEAVRNGPLSGITYGLGLVEQLQPYHIKPEPRADYLWQIHRFSNADKHRALSAFIPIPTGSELELSHDGDLIEEIEPDIQPPWNTDLEIELIKIRFARPPSHVHATAKSSILVHFGTPGFGSEEGQAMDLPMVEATCEHVRMVVALFEGI